jgi:hypothetical protein
MAEGKGAMMHETPWTEARVKTLRDMWGKHPPAVIAERLSTTRNAVIGKADRIGLRGEGPRLASQKHHRLPPGEAARRRQEREKARTEKRRLAAAAKAAARPKPEPRLPLLVIPRKRQAVAAFTGNPVTLELIGAGQCRWIVGNEGHGKDTLMCSAPVEPTACRPFCPEHTARARGHVAQKIDGIATLDTWTPSQPAENAA